MKTKKTLADLMELFETAREQSSEDELEHSGRDAEESARYLVRVTPEGVQIGELRPALPPELEGLPRSFELSIVPGPEEIQ